MTKLTPEQKLIVEKIDNLQKTIDRFYDDFREDRRARGNMEVAVKNIANATSMAREDLADNQKDTKRAVEDGIKEAIKPVETKINKLTASKSSVIHYIEDKRKSKRFLFWKRGEKK